MPTMLSLSPGNGGSGMPFCFNFQASDEHPEIPAFRVASTNTTPIECRETPDCEPVNFRILRDDIAAPTDRDDVPAKLHPTARSETRKTHLEKEVECYFTQDAQEHLPWK